MSSAVPWAQIGMTVAAAFVAAAGREIFLAIFGRRKAKVEEADVLSGVAVALVAPLRHELDLVRREARALARELKALRVAIMSPEATLALLRDMVRKPSTLDSNEET